MTASSAGCTASWWISPRPSAPPRRPGRSPRPAACSPDVLVDPRVGYTSEVRARIELGTVRAGLAVPLIARGTVIGALAVGARAGRVFDAPEIRLAEAFADQAAVALAGARLHEEVSQAHGFLRSVVENRTDAVLTTDVHG